MSERAQRICAEWSADFEARGLDEEATFWKNIKLVFVAGGVAGGTVGEQLEEAIRRAERRSTITPPAGLDEETLEAINEIKSEAAYLVEAMGALRRRTH